VEYYLYISDAKVDMLLPQISDAHKKKVETEYGVNFKVFAAKQKVAQDENEDRIARLKVVTEFIRDFGNLGTVEKPDVYIEDALPMLFFVSEGSVYFSGAEGNTYLGLGGSRSHLMGFNKKLLSNAEGTSLGPQILQAINESLVKAGISHTPNKNFDAIPAFHKHMSMLGNPLQNVRFMAKRLYMMPLEDKEQNIIIIGSPLYVTLED
jgi:hypothetical protein